MASVIDSLVVTLGLDAKGFASGIKGSASELAGFTRRLTGMFLAIRGIEDVVGYFQDLHKTLADVGFESRNLGYMGTELKRLGEVSELFGGQAQDASDSIEGLQAAVFNLKYRGQMSESLIMLQRFGVAYLTAAGNARQFKDIARDAAAVIERQTMDQGERTQLALSMGFTGGFASAVAHGTAGFEKAFAQATQDQAALSEKTIKQQVALSRDITRKAEARAAKNSNILSTMTPLILAANAELQKLTDKWLPIIDKDLQGILGLFQKPPPWLQGIETAGGKLGVGGTALAAAGGLTFGRAALSTLFRALFGGGVGALAGVSAGGAAGAVGTGLLPGVAAGYAFDKLFPNNWLADLGGWLGSEIYDMANPPNGQTPLSARSGRIVRSPSPPTPNAQRPALSNSGQGSSVAFVGSGGTNVEIGQMTINTRATDANGIAQDINGALQRKVVVSSADGGQQ